MSIKPPSRTSAFFRILGQFVPKEGEHPPDTLDSLLHIARHKLMNVDGIDCCLPLSLEACQKVITSCLEDEVYTRPTELKLEGVPMIGNASGRECSFVYSYSAPSHADYQAITHILILQTDGHTLRVDTNRDEGYYELYPCKVGDIIQFNIEWSHALLATDNTELPFVGLTYDTYLSFAVPHVHSALNKKTALPFFQKLATMLLEQHRV